MIAEQSQPVEQEIIKVHHTAFSLAFLIVKGHLYYLICEFIEEGVAFSNNGIHLVLGVGGETDDVPQYVPLRESPFFGFKSQVSNTGVE